MVVFLIICIVVLFIFYLLLSKVQCKTSGVDYHHSQHFFLLFAGFGAGRQKRKHSEHALSITFQHRDGSADHLQGFQQGGAQRQGGQCYN